MLGMCNYLEYYSSYLTHVSYGTEIKCKDKRGMNYGLIEFCNTLEFKDELN